MLATMITSTAAGILSASYIEDSTPKIRQHAISRHSPWINNYFLPNLLRANPEMKGDMTDAMPA